MYERLIFLLFFFLQPRFWVSQILMLILSFTVHQVLRTYSIQKSHSIFAGKNSPEPWLFDLGIQGVWGEGGIPKKF